MREILFRGKRIDNGAWVEGTIEFHLLDGDLTQTERYAFITYDTMDKIGKVYQHSYRVDPATVGQYTGLVDKNGKKIFEGDYVKATIKKHAYDGMTETETTQKGLVAYDSIGMIGLALEVRDGRYVWSDCFLELAMSDSIIDYCFEVIGNIHDNPELLR